ncbi:TetR/AcrR family transcriptional regulator [Pseudonocardia sp. MH-G8]|uniref:TetR/AcrR family transcriptional regulator n=1 Tax=Pseudonocardia sp. MH-G8 TaxID=1854588 RepID=UPI000BA055C4|nr:TetR/AcrR family transcriptional regulator [Pseudonocardia sp. MH-G8]OZM82163.1 TetR family transcriptional regulator [Pseudonocardia sp. MH-G8]
MGEAGNDGRPPRADKQRNRVHILEVAEQFFAEHGISGSMDAIAKRAGVGPGTLYRHFPSREALLAALLQARDEELEVRRASIQREESDSSVALTQWLDALGEWVTAFDGLPEPLRAALTGGKSPLAITCQGFITTTEEFLRAAQREGAAKPWVRGRDLFLSTLATAWAHSAALADESSPEALSTLMRSGWEMAADRPRREGPGVPGTET